MKTIKRIAIVFLAAFMLFVLMGFLEGNQNPSPTPTATLTITPTATPTEIPTATPTEVPTATPTAIPTATPTIEPTAVPTEIPTIEPTIIPILNKTKDVYVEISIEKQHLWLYKMGKIIADGPVVTGGVSWGTPTPTGTFNVNHRESPKTFEEFGLVSKYWMRFNGGVGMHDANWRIDSEFGGTTYLWNGSHGCINCPIWLAEILWNNTEIGTYVIVY